jgi:predicted CopG family antitoxin
MLKKLTITINEEVYNGLYSVVGQRKISQFIENLIKPYVLKPDLLRAYKELASDELREQEAHYWIEGVVGDIKDEER